MVITKMIEQVKERASENTAGTLLNNRAIWEVLSNCINKYMETGDIDKETADMLVGYHESGFGWMLRGSDFIKVIKENL